MAGLALLLRFHGVYRPQVSFLGMSPQKFVFMAYGASQVCFHGGVVPQGYVRGACRRTSLLLWRVSPHSLFSWCVSPSKLVFMACVASQLCFHGECRLLSSFSWRVSPHKFVFMACVTSQVCFMACVTSRLFSWRASPSKFGFQGVCRPTSLFSWHVFCHNSVSMACVAFKFFFRRVSPKLVFTACVTSRVCSHGACRLLSSFSWPVSPLELVFGVCRLSH